MWGARAILNHGRVTHLLHSPGVKRARSALVAVLLVLSSLVGVVLATPGAAEAAPSRATAPLDIDIRGGEYPAGSPTATGTIKPGDGATFSVSVYLPGSDKPTPFATLARMARGPVHFVLWYGWGVAGVVTENGCTQIAQGITKFCYLPLSSPAYDSRSSSGDVVWQPTTLPAPNTPKLSTLFDAIWLENARDQVLAKSAAGNFEHNLTAKTVFLSSTWGSGVPQVSSGTKVSLEACITDKNCSSGLVSSGNFLGDYLYVCASWPPYGPGGVPVTKNLPTPEPQHWWSGKADQVLGGIVQSFTPPTGQSWSVFYYAFASSHPHLARGAGATCPTSPAEVDAGSATGVTNDFASMMVTWQGPPAVPPSVQLVASAKPTQANEQVTFEASATRPDGNAALYLCAYSGASWLTLSPMSRNGYLNAVAVVPGQVPHVEGAASGAGGTAEFLAFLSTSSTAPTSCPAPDKGSAADGTLAPPGWSTTSGTWHASYDYSNVVNVTWPAAPTVRPHITLQVTTTHPHAGGTVQLQATYSHLPKGDHGLYICERSGTAKLHLSGQSPYAASVGAGAAFDEARAVASSGLFAGAMASYVEWLAVQVAERGMSAVRSEVASTEESLVECLGSADARARTASAVAALAAGWQWWLAFCRATGALAPETSQPALEAALGHLRTLAVAQGPWREGGAFSHDAGGRPRRPAEGKSR